MTTHDPTPPHGTVALEASLRAFHAHVGHPHPTTPTLPDAPLDPLYRDARVQLEHVWLRLKRGALDDAQEPHRRLRFIVEELSELVEALEMRDPVATLDALADLLYVVVGTAVAFGLPIEAAFNEVHCSNMTKTAQPHAKATKGPAYRPPDLKRVLRDHLEKSASQSPLQA